LSRLKKGGFFMVNLNGNLTEKASVSFDNRGLNYGDAVFETLRFSGGKIYFWEDHYFRLMASMRILRMEIPMNFTMEFPIQVSPSLLYQYISTPSGLSEWYADNVNSRGEFYTFIWSGSEERAKLLSKKSPERIKFRWVEDEGEEFYFELRIQVDEITKDVSLMVTDYAEEDEIEEGKMLWDNMISNLKQILGSV
jgi:uncharacterized protein YndB with AHSA1/START domain